MSRVVFISAVVFAIVGAVARPVVAQPGNVDPAFSDTIISTFGYPEIAIEVSPEGVEAPTELATGFYHVTLTATGEDNLAYLDFMQPRAGISEEEMTELALAAGAGDLAQEGWVYAGGTNTPNPGEPATFVIELKPGEYQIAASIYATEEGAEETMRLTPLTVTAAATPVASPVATVEPPATVTLEMSDDLRYTVGPDPVPAGPQVWKIANSGEHHAHHAVIFRGPDGMTAEQIVAEFSAMMSGTPPAAEPLMAQFAWTAYAALQSGGQTTWAEFDMESGTYAVICYIIDPHTGQPHVVNGMATVFTVE